MNIIFLDVGSGFWGLQYVTVYGLQPACVTMLADDNTALHKQCVTSTSQP